MRNLIVAVSIIIYGQFVFASSKIIAEVFSYPFKPITINVVHYQFLDTGEGQVVVVRPDGTKDTPIVLVQLSQDRVKALLNTIELVKNSALVSNPSKESSTCIPNNGFAEYYIYNSQGESLLIAKREYCNWFNIDQISATLIELTLDGLPPINYLRN